MNLTYGRYEQYELRIRAIARILRWIRRFKWLLITGAFFIAAAFAFVGIVPGIFTQDAACADHIYGEALQYQAEAILSDVSYEFSTTEEGAAWTNAVPASAGTYRIRAVSQNGYGTPRYSEEMLFTIHPAALTITVKDRSQIYGDISEYSAEDVDIQGLQGSDRLGEISFTSKDISIREMMVEVDQFTIVNSKNEDVTACYTVNLTSGSLVFDQRVLGLSSQSQSKIYDGTTLQEPPCEITSGTLAPGNEITFIHDPYASITATGSAEAHFTAIITDEQGRDVTDNYKIDYHYGTLTVHERPITIAISDASKVYDGTPLAISDYKITDGSLPVGHLVQLHYQTETAITKVGTLPVQFTADVLDSKGNNVSEHYKLTYVQPTLTVTPRTIAFASASVTKVYDDKPLDQTSYSVTTGSLADNDTAYYTLDPSAVIRDVGTSEAKFSARITNAFGEDVSNQYVISYQYGKLTVKLRPIEIQTCSASKEYDGTALKNDSMTIVSGSTVSNHKIQVTYIDAPIYAGEYINTAEIRIVADKNRDVTSNYDIQVYFGTLKIDYRNLTIQSGSTVKTYDGRPLTYNKWQVISGSVVKGHRLTVTLTGTQTDVGESPNTMVVRITDNKGNDVTSLGYQITLQNGSLRVTPRRITISSESATAIYTGRPFKYPFVTYLNSSLVLNHTVAYECTGSQTEIGSSSNFFTAQIMTRDGKDVSYNYDILLMYGTLTVISPIEYEPGDDVIFPEGEDIPLPPEDEKEDVPEEVPEDSNDYTLGIPKFDSIFAVMQVKFEKGGSTFLRRESYGDYTGSGFDFAPLYQNTDGQNPLSFAGLNLHSSGKVESQSLIIYRENADGYDYLPYYTNITLANNGTDDNHIDNYSRNYSLWTATDYDYRVFEGISTRSNLVNAERAYRTFVYENYLSVPEETAKILQALADSNGISKDSPTLIGDIQAYIQHAATYNLYAADYPKGVDQVVYFLTVAKEGVCQQYAASATLMYRLFGIPARYTVGYSIRGEAGVVTDVLNTQGHAWVEIYLDGIGWVAVEVTGGSYATTADPKGKPASGGGECDGNCDGDCEGVDIGGEELDKLDNVIYARVRTETATALYLREMSFGNYNGSSWSHIDPYASSSGTKPIYYAGEAIEASGKKLISESVNVQLRPGCPYLLPYYTTDSYSSAYEETDNQVLFKSSNYTIKTHTSLKYRDFLGVESASKNKVRESSYRTYVYDNYLHVPQNTKAALLEIARQNGLSAASKSLITDVQVYIQSCAKYKKEVEDYPENADTVLYFLNEAKEGNCQHFASAATLMYRALGIPARFTVGFMVETEAGTYVPVKGENAHAWVEVYIDGLGWIQIEVTGIVEGVPTEMGEKTIQLRPDGRVFLSVSTPDVEKVYDGAGVDAPTKNICILRKGDLMVGHQMKVTYNNSKTINAGESLVNEISQIQIFDMMGNDVTDRYVIEMEYGTLTVLKRPITVTSTDASKPYDGTALTDGRYWISSGSLAKGHKLIVSVTGSITKEGSANNTFTLSIVDENGNSVIHQYDVKTVYGLLRVTAPQ